MHNIWPLIFLIVFLALVFLSTSQGSDRKSLRHTVNVNLGILKAELEELSPLVEALPDGDNKKAEALLLLRDCRLVVEYAERPYPIGRQATHHTGRVLTHVFSGMDKSTRLRRLLGACKPYAGE